MGSKIFYAYTTEYEVTTIGGFAIPFYEAP